MFNRHELSIHRKRNTCPGKRGRCLASLETRQMPITIDNFTPRDRQQLIHSWYCNYSHLRDMGHSLVKIMWELGTRLLRIWRTSYTGAPGTSIVQIRKKKQSKTGNYPKFCPQDSGLKKNYGIHTVEYYAPLNMNELGSITWRDTPLRSKRWYSQQIMNLGKIQVPEGHIQAANFTTTRNMENEAAHWFRMHRQDLAFLPATKQSQWNQQANPVTE